MMTNRASNRYTPCSILFVRGMLLFLIFVLGLSAAPRNVRGGNVDKDGGTPTEGMASNQGVSLEGEVEALESQPISGEGNAQVPRPSSENNATMIVAGSRLIKRGRGAGGSTVESHVPWYRTGMGALLVVLVLIGTVFLILRRVAPNSRAVESRLIRLCGRATLTPKHNVALIQIGQRFVLVGLSGERMATLCEIGDPEEVAGLSARLAGAGTAPRINPEFHRMLQHETRAFELEEEEAEAPNRPASDETAAGRPIRELLSRLRNLRSGAA